MAAEERPPVGCRAATRSPVHYVDVGRVVAGPGNVGVRTINKVVVGPPRTEVVSIEVRAEVSDNSTALARERNRLPGAIGCVGAVRSDDIGVVPRSPEQVTQVRKPGLYLIHPVDLQAC